MAVTLAWRWGMGTRLILSDKSIYFRISIRTPTESRTGAGCGRSLHKACYFSYLGTPRKMSSRRRTCGTPCALTILSQFKEV